MTTQPVQPASFGETLLHALEYFTDPAALGRSSPLATPYLLGHHLAPADTDERARGRVLQRVLQAATAELTGDDATLHQAILHERYFKGRSAAAARDLPKIALGKTQYFTHQKRAVARLEPHLLNQLNPTIRLEQPVALQGDLIDRDQPLARSLAALTQKQTVMLTGSGGVGKTTLGSRLAAAWGRDVLWFTVRPGLNDHLASFLFELAYFCHLRSASWLWQELIANKGNLPASRVPAIVRHTLDHLPTLPLIAIDEADLLLTTSDSPAATDTTTDTTTDATTDATTSVLTASTQSLLQLLNALRSTVPILAMGQRAALDADHYEPLTGLSAPLTNVLLKTHRVILSPTNQTQLHRYTAGNPRLIHLLIALHHSGEPLDMLLDQLPRSPSIHFLLGRMLQRLTATEIGVLMDLAVFHVAAPADVWQQRLPVANALLTLHEHHLLQLDQQGGVALLPAYRDVLLAEMPDDKRCQLHANAATIYTRRGRYTLAAYHLSHTATPERAIWFWHGYQQQEINRGQAYPALQLFRRMRHEKTELALSAAAYEQVMTYCVRLEALVGNPTSAAADLRSILIKTPILQVEAAELGGVLANDRGDHAVAEQLFQHAIATAEQLVEVQLAHAYKGLGWRYRNERELEQAWHYGLLAQYEVANFQGEVQLRRCAYNTSIAYLQEALVLAEQVGHTSGIAKTCNNLGQIYARTGHIVEAEAYFDRAEAVYKEIGKVTVFDGMTINRAFVWNLAGRFAASVDLLHQFLADKAQKHEPLSPELTALAYQNLAEALLGVGALAEAEAAVQQAIDQEEIQILPDALRTHGEIKLQQGHPEEAARLIGHALELIEQSDAPDLYLAGYAWRALAQVYEAQGAREKAAEVRTKAVDCFIEINLPNEVEKTI